MNDVHLAKVASIQRSVARARQEFAAAGEGFSEDVTRQDAAVLNVLRACETAIDLANTLVREQKLGVPQSNRDSFRLLCEAGVVTGDVAARLQRMVGFRNIAVHRYRDLDVAVRQHASTPTARLSAKIPGQAMPCRSKNTQTISKAYA